MDYCVMIVLLFCVIGLVLCVFSSAYLVLRLAGMVFQNPLSSQMPSYLTEPDDVTDDELINGYVNEQTIAQAMGESQLKQDGILRVEVKEPA